MMVTSNVRLVRPLGEGGMGSVWVAEHLSLHTHVVVKFMSRDLAESPDAVARFSREAAAASQVKSPHVVQMLDHGVGDTGAPYIVMELLEGTDLEEHLRASGVLDRRQTVGIVGQLARALSKAHEQGIVHRDIKPSNVFLLDAGAGEVFVKLLDFGIAKGPPVGIVGDTTKTGAFVGSPFYMSRVHVVGTKNLDFRSDLWSLGVVVYEMLTVKKPFFADNVGALALQIHRDPLPVPSREDPSLPAALDAWFARACAREMDQRFGSAKEMAAALAVALTGQDISVLPAPRSTARAWRTAGVGMGVVAVVAGLLAPRLWKGGGAPVADASPAVRVPVNVPVSVSVPASELVTVTPLASPIPTTSASTTTSAPISSSPVASSHRAIPRVSATASAPSLAPSPASASASASASHPAAAPTTTRGNDDDIK